MAVTAIVQENVGVSRHTVLQVMIPITPDPGTQRDPFLQQDSKAGGEGKQESSLKRVFLDFRKYTTHKDRENEILGNHRTSFFLSLF